MNATATARGNLIVQVSDDNFNLLVGANVKLLEYKATVDSFVEVAQCFSDTNGECVFDVELDTKFYIIQATFIDGDNVLTAQSTENGQLIKLDQTIIEIRLTTSKQFEVEDTFNLIITPSNTELVGNTSFLTATFNDNTNKNHTVCIAYYFLNGINEVELNETCVTASAGIVNAVGGFLLVDRDFTHIAKIYVIREDGTKLIYNKYTYPALGEKSFLSSFGLFVDILIFAALLFLLGTALYIKNIKVFAIGAIVLSPLSLSIKPFWIGGTTMVFIILLCISIIYLTSKKQEFG